MKNWHFTLCALLIGTHALADTFVGNGGGQGDVELAVTKKQIIETFTVVKDHPSAEYCRCNPAFENRSVCDALFSLSESERNFCSKAMVSQADSILKMVSGERRILIRWTDKPIDVNERGQLRAVDAVTDPAKLEITINLKRFLEMKPFERVFLLTHELGHLTTIDGKAIADIGPVGPFAGEDGGRRFLNALGSSAAVLQGEYPKDIARYRARLNRSQSWKPVWLEGHVGTASVNSGTGQTFASKSFHRTGLTARYNFGDFGLVAAFRNEGNNFRALGSVDVDEDINIYSLGASYRFFPFGDPLTFWGQTHFQVQALVDYVVAKIHLREDVVPALDDQEMKWGGSLSLSYYVPLFWGVWSYVGMGYEYHPYRYDKLNVEYKKGLTSSFLGVGYAF